MDETLTFSDQAEKSPVLKALRMLSHVARSHAPIALADLSRALNLPKPTSYRLARTLELAGFVQRDPLTRRYIVGSGFEDVALSALRHGAGHGARRLLMDELAERIGARINIAVLKSGKLLFVEWVESTSPLRVDLKPEVQVPVHCSASGKLMLAFGPDELSESFFRSAPFKPLTKNTLTTAKALQRELAEIRRRGYSEDNEEFLPGVCCLAVPVRNASGDVVAGLAAMAPTMSLSLQKIRTHLPDLMACAERIAFGIGHVPNGTAKSPIRQTRTAPRRAMQGSRKGRKLSRSGDT